MNIAKLNDWMQVVGIFALVASLVFVGLQLRQTQEIALSNAYQARMATSIAMVTTNASNINGMAAWYRPKSEADLALLAPEEQWAGTQMSLGLLLTYDNIHFQFEHGFISEEGWNNTRVNLKEVMGFPFVRRYMLSQLERMRPSFKQAVVEIDKELSTETQE